MPASSDKRPLDLALDLLVYAPVGLAVAAQELLPRLAARGRERLTGRITTARVVGQFAVQQGQAQAGRVFTRPAPNRPPAGTAAPAAPPPAAAPAEPRPSAPAATPAPAPAPGPADAALAIPGYDSLSASQVLPRLEGLSVAELEAVRAYETAHRGRRTILGRVAQLQSAP